MHVVVYGAGVAGLTTAFALQRQGADVSLVEKRDDIPGNASWLAGGMLAPWCERESAEEPVLTLGKSSADWWETALPGQVTRKGTLVVAPPRDLSELGRFAARTSGFDWVAGDEIASLESDLEGRFAKGLFFSGEAHLNPRQALLALKTRLIENGANLYFGKDALPASVGSPDWEVDATGIAAPDKRLRGVRGEMLLLQTADVALQRPVRMLHPRIPIYIVPRPDNRFMVGATMIENEDDGPISARSMMELLNAAYALHPAFAEAQIVETGVGVRPSYADNLPRVTREGRKVRVNGMYRHGFLLSPAMAEEAAETIMMAQKEETLEAHG